jgi:hypothetical protein
MSLFRENLHLKELVAIVQSNEDFFRDFLLFLKQKGYSNVRDFMQEDDDELAFELLRQYLRRHSNVTLYDGLLRPYKATQARWYFLAWLCVMHQHNVSIPCSLVCTVEMLTNVEHTY